MMHYHHKDNRSMQSLRLPSLATAHFKRSIKRRILGFTTAPRLKNSTSLIWRITLRIEAFSKPQDLSIICGVNGLTSKSTRRMCLRRVDAPQTSFKCGTWDNMTFFFITPQFFDSISKVLPTMDRCFGQIIKSLRRYSIWILGQLAWNLDLGKKKQYCTSILGYALTYAMRLTGYKASQSQPNSLLRVCYCKANSKTIIS